MPSDITVPKDLDLDSPLWRFAGRIWSRTLARDACLNLQAQGWSVTDLLCALWLTSENTLFAGLDDDLTLFWRSTVTERLRQVRKAIQKGNPATDIARDCVAQSEIESEKVELALAYRALIGTLAGNSASNQFKNVTAQELALENLQAAAPEKAMNNKTGKLLETLADELQFAGELVSC